MEQAVGQIIPTIEESSLFQAEVITFMLADLYVRNNLYDKSIAELDKIIEYEKSMDAENEPLAELLWDKDWDSAVFAIFSLSRKDRIEPMQRMCILQSMPRMISAPIFCHRGTGRWSVSNTKMMAISTGS